MEFEKIVKERYATKKFDGRMLPEPLVVRLLEMIRLSPSSYNILPWTIIVVTDKKTKEKLASAAWNQPQIKSCSHLLVFCANKDIAGNITRLEKLLLKNGVKPESVKSSIQMMRNFASKMTEEQKLSWAQRQTYLALGNALNGAKALGFDSCPMEGFDADAYAKILELPPHLVPAVLCPIGYAADMPRTKIRFPIEDIIQEK